VSRTISQRELRNESGEIMRRLNEGESFVVTRNGTPVGELSPLRRHRFISAEAAVAVFVDAPKIDATQFRADVDGWVDQGIQPRG
jgi:prevent-host-death family protein